MREIDWVKDAIGTCITDHVSEKKAEFEALEKRYHAFSEAERNLIRNIIQEQLKTNDRIYIYSILMHYMPDKEFAEDMIDLFAANRFHAFIGSMLEFHTYLYYDYIKHLYGKRRAFHKKNVQEFEKILKVDYPYIKPADRNTNRIVIVLEQLLSIRHAPTKMALDMIWALKKNGYELFLFSCPNDAGLPADLWHLCMISTSSETLKHQPWQVSYRGEIFEGYQISMNTKESFKEYHMMMTFIHTWNPMFVFAFGVSNPVVDLIGKFTTLVAGEPSITCPVSEGKILVRLDREEEKLEREYAKVVKEESQTQFFMKEKFPVIMQSSEESYTRAEAGLPEHKFLAAIVGNRLDEDVSNEFITVMYRILETASDLDFVIIGEADVLKERLTDCRFENRIHFMGYCENLMKLYRILDLYLNPDRRGGGFSGAMALNSGLPVVTLPEGDVAYHVGDEFIVKDYEEMVKIVERYASDKDFCHEKAAIAQRHVEKSTDLELVEYMRSLTENVTRLIHEKE